MDKLQPTRIVTATRLITLTTTYETELTQDEFLSLTPILNLTTRLLGHTAVVNLETLAMELICDYGDLFTEIIETGNPTPDFQRILTIANAFDYKHFDKLMLSQYLNDPAGYIINDGNYQSVALALLIKSEQIKYQPVTARYTEIEQSEVEQLTPDQTVLAKTIAETQKGMHHYLVRRK